MYSSVGPTKEIYPYEIEHTGGPYNEVYYEEISKRYNYPFQMAATKLQV